MCGDIQFGSPHIRPAQQQIGRDILQHGAVHQRNQSGVFGHQRERPRRTTDQHTQRIADTTDLILKPGDGAQSPEVLGLGLLQVEFGSLAAVEQFFRNLVIALLLTGVLPGHAQPRFGGAQGKIGVGNLGPQQYQRIFIIGFGREITGIG
ncbi:hypothetical protein D3C84_762790 [compost metagenome]